MQQIANQYSNSEMRVVIRRSGTEHSKVRIMVEGSGDVNALAKEIENLLQF
jgi:phosphomannomutase